VQFCDKTRPLRSEHVRPGEGSITTANDEGVDTLLDHIERGFQSSFVSAEGLGPCSADQSSALMDRRQHSPATRMTMTATYLRHPSTNIVPTNPDDIPPLERPSPRMIKSSVPQQSSISKPQGLEELGIGDLNVLRNRGIVVRRQFHVLIVSEYEAFVSFANDPSLASPVEKVKREISRRVRLLIRVKKTEKEVANFTIPALTTPRTTAFIPALSPPEVSTAIFIFSRCRGGGGIPELITDLG